MTQFKEETKHTPTPWIVRQKGDDCFVQGPRNKPDDYADIEVLGDDTNEDFYSDEQKLADARFIVRACNAHDELVASLDETTHRLIACKNHLLHSMVDGELKRKFIEYIDGDIERNRAALRKARDLDKGEA